MVANHGRQEKYVHLIEGFNYRLDTLQAAVLQVKLGRLEEQVERRVALAAKYEEQLAGLDLRFQGQAPGTRHARHLLVIQTSRRDALQVFLKQHNIETGIHYPIPLHLQPAYGKMGLGVGSFPVAEETAKTSLSLPLYPQMSDWDVDYVCDRVREFFERD
jgi:dTDP-4-amino-4,6-dideoxygalactose transaminase